MQGKTYEDMNECRSGVRDGRKTNGKDWEKAASNMKISVTFPILTAIHHLFFSLVKNSPAFSIRYLGNPALISPAVVAESLIPPSTHHNGALDRHYSP